jgi:hypothetical protein
MIDYELMDEILKQLEDIKYQVDNAEDAYGQIVQPEKWGQLFGKLRKLIKIDQER